VTTNIITDRDWGEELAAEFTRLGYDFRFFAADVGIMGRMVDGLIVVGFPEGVAVRLVVARRLDHIEVPHDGLVLR
jgi:hypothetical protein